MNNTLNATILLNSPYANILEKMFPKDGENNNFELNQLTHLKEVLTVVLTKASTGVIFSKNRIRYLISSCFMSFRKHRWISSETAKC